jgi:glycosyltransferase involved in cell wall biosynthesis
MSLFSMMMACDAAMELLSSLDTFPIFSIVIPTYNRPQPLHHCLSVLLNLDYPRDRFEVIVVDDGSSVALQPVIAPFQDPLSLTLVRQDNGGPAKARNTGAAIASGEFIAFTDDDCAPAPHWLRAFAQQFQSSPHALLGGNTLNYLSGNIYATAHQSLVDYLYQHYNANPNQAKFFTSNNIALSREGFRQIGCFNTTFPLAAGEDRELCDRWLHQGYGMCYVSAAVVHHTHSMTLRSFWRQHFNYGQGAFHFHQLRAQRGTGQITVESLAFYCKLLLYPFHHPTDRNRLSVAGLFLLSQIANTLGFLWKRSQHSPIPT